MMKLYRAEDKYAMPLELQLFAITAKHTHYVTLQLRLATLMAIWWRTRRGAFGCRERVWVLRAIFPSSSRNPDWPL